MEYIGTTLTVTAAPTSPFPARQTPKATVGILSPEGRVRYAGKVNLEALRIPWHPPTRHKKLDPDRAEIVDDAAQKMTMAAAM